MPLDKTVKDAINLIMDDTHIISVLLADAMPCGRHGVC